jgi:hypothetical protein
VNARLRGYTLFTRRRDGNTTTTSAADGSVTFLPTAIIPGPASTTSLAVRQIAVTEGEAGDAEMID